MIDHEFLELAAKAAGFSVDKRASFMTWRESQRLALLNPQGGHTLWNPLADDGDALRLAVKLNLWEAVRDGYQHLDSYDDHNQYAATRRSIVRAAALLAKS